MEETKIFLITYIVALLGVVPPGLVNMSVANTCVKHGKKSGLFVATGASVVVFFQALFAILLAKYIFDNPYVHNILLRAGLVIFILLTIFFFVKAKRDTHIKTYSKKANANSLFKGILIAVLNVFPIPYFVALAAALNIEGDISYHWGIIFLFILAASLGAFTTLYLYVLFFPKIVGKTKVFTKYSNYFMATLMLVLVIITIFRIFYY